MKNEGGVTVLSDAMCVCVLVCEILSYSHLDIVLRVPVTVEYNHSVGSRKIDAYPASPA